MDWSDSEAVLGYYRGLVAGGSDYVGYSEPMLKRTVIDTVLSLPGTKIVEAGAGPNPIVPFTLAKNGREVTVVELSSDFCETARTNAERLGVTVEILCAPAHQLPLDDRSQDIAVMTEVLEHIPDPLELPTLRELRRVLKDEGHLVISVPNERSWLMRWNAWRNGEKQQNEEHLREYTHASLTARVEEAGFVVQKRLRVPSSDTSFGKARAAWVIDRINPRPESGLKAALVARVA